MFYLNAISCITCGGCCLPPSKFGRGQAGRNGDPWDTTDTGEPSYHAGFEQCHAGTWIFPANPNTLDNTNLYFIQIVIISQF